MFAVSETAKASEGAGIECTPRRARPTQRKIEKSIVTGVILVFMKGKTVMRRSFGIALEMCDEC